LSGKFDTVNEISPIDRWMLVQHPLVFVCWVAAWIAAFSVVILCLPARAGQVLALTLMFGNAAGASSWIGWRLPHGFWICYGLFFAIGALVVLTWDKAGLLALAKRRAVPGGAEDRVEERPPGNSFG
jgi:hypothetical protein